MTGGYQEYYQIVTIIFLGISFGNLGLERAFTNSNLDIKLSLLKIARSRIFFGLFVFFVLTTYLESGLIIATLSSIIVLTNFTTIGEFLYVGKHLKRPLITIKLLIVLCGLFLRYLYNDIHFFLAILLFESIIFGVVLTITTEQLSKTGVVEKHSAFKTSETIYSFLLLSLSFLVTRLYVYYDLGLSTIELKYLHISDYIVVVASFAASVIIRLGINYNLKVLLNSQLFTMVVVLALAFLFNNQTIYYVAAKLISALNVMYIYLLFSKREIKESFLINLGSLLLMLSFFAFSSKENIFIWMLLSEASVLICAAFLNSQKKI